MLFRSLVASIDAYGILQSIVVEYRETSNKTFDLVCVSGHRRLEALRKSERKEKIPAKLVMFNRKGASVGIALSENVNRQNLHFIELADSYLFLHENEEMTPRTLAERFDKNERTVSTYLKMAKWPNEIKNIILENQDIFPLRYIWDNFAKKNVSKGQILRMLKMKLNKPSKDSSSQSKSSKPKSKIERMKKLDSYFLSQEISSDLRSEIIKALEFLKLI